jgi:hypothetical protein
LIYPVTLPHGVTVSLIEGNPDRVFVYGTCIVSKKEYKFGISKKAFEEWYEHKGIIQHVAAEVSADRREFLLSGISPTGWEMIFGGPDSPAGGPSDDDTLD